MPMKSGFPIPSCDETSSMRFQRMSRREWRLMASGREV
jgi:hypothetical protein